MAARIKNSEWEEDIELENNLKEQVSRNLGQSELVDFISQISDILLESEHSILSSPSFWDQVHWLLCRYRRGERGCGERNERARKVIRLPLTTQEGFEKDTDSRSQEIWCMTLWQTYIRQVLRKEVAWGCQNILRELGLSPQMWTKIFVFHLILFPHCFLFSIFFF